MYHFEAVIKIIGVNPYVLVPDEILDAIFEKAKKNKGPIPVHGRIKDRLFTQTLVRYAGDWRLYINTKMLKDSPKHVGEVVEIMIDFDPRDRTLPIHSKLQAALDNDIEARRVFASLAPYRQHEINRYISRLRSEAKVTENIERAVAFLHGKGSFAGRSKP